MSAEQVIGDGCAQNVPAELHYEDAHGISTTGRVRLLELTDQEILADRPLYAGDGRQIPVGVPITVHLSVGGVRYKFESAIEEGRRFVRLNERQTVPAIALRKPATVTDSQRRSALRIPMAGAESVYVNLVRPHPKIPGACAIDAERFSGLLADLSVGGMGVLVDHDRLSEVHPGERFFLTFALPTDKEAFCMLGAVRHARVIKTSNTLRVGLSFCQWNGPRFTHDQRRISQSVAELERRSLRRRK